VSLKVNLFVIVRTKAAIHMARAGKVDDIYLNTMLSLMQRYDLNEN